MAADPLEQARQVYWDLWTRGERIKKLARQYGETQMYRYGQSLQAMYLDITHPIAMNTDALESYYHRLRDEISVASREQLEILTKKVNELKDAISFRAEMITNSFEFQTDRLRRDLLARLNSVGDELRELISYQSRLVQLSNAAIAQAITDAWNIDLDTALRQFREAAEKIRLQELEELARRIGGL